MNIPLKLISAVRSLIFRTGWMVKDLEDFLSKKEIMDSYETHQLRFQVAQLQAQIDALKQK